MSRLPDLEAMAIFATVVEMRGITAAAEHLGLSAPTVSKALARLEQQFGTPLFHRTSRRLTLTESGRDLSARAARILAEAEDAECALMDQAAAPRGLIRLAVPMSFGVREVAPLLPAFLTRYPDVTLDLHLSDAVVDIVADGFDAALRIGALPDSSLRSRRLADVPRAIVAAPSYLQRRGRPAHPQELQSHACFGYAYGQNRDVWTFVHTSGEEVSVRPTGQLRVNNGEAALPALAQGLGIAMTPVFIVRDLLQCRELEVLLPEWHLAPIALYLLTPPNGPTPARLRVLSEYLVQALGRPAGKRPAVPPEAAPPAVAVQPLEQAGNESHHTPLIP